MPQLNVPLPAKKMQVTDSQNGDVGISMADVATDPEVAIGRFMLRVAPSINAEVVLFTAEYVIEPVIVGEVPPFTVRLPW